MLHENTRPYITDPTDFDLIFQPELVVPEAMPVYGPVEDHFPKDFDDFMQNRYDPSDPDSEELLRIWVTSNSRAQAKERYINYLYGYAHPRSHQGVGIFFDNTAPLLVQKWRVHHETDV